MLPLQTGSNTKSIKDMRQRGEDLLLLVSFIRNTFAFSNQGSILCDHRGSDTTDKTWWSETDQPITRII